MDHIEVPVTDPARACDSRVYIFSNNLERDHARGQELGAKISREISPFPGGRRFHFVDAVGTAYALWSSS